MKSKRFLAMILAISFLCPIAASAIDTQRPNVYKFVDDEILSDGSVADPYYLSESGERIEFPSAEEYVSAASEVDVPSMYDGRDHNFITSVRNQGASSNCWGFGMISIFEANYVRRGYGTMDTTDFSERHLINFTLREQISDPLSPLYGDGVFYENPFLYGGSWRNAANGVLSGIGVALEKDYPWTVTFKRSELASMTLSDSERYKSEARLTDAVQLNALSTSGIKQWIMENGSALMSYYDDSNAFANPGSYNTETGAYYQNTISDRINHVTTVIGWDDNYPTKCFSYNNRPNYPGAWLCKNSWGDEWCNGGFYWISYEEASISEFIGCQTTKKDEYDNVYCYDGSNTTIVYDSENGTGSFANVFKADNDELLTHVAFYNPNTESVDATIQIYKGKPKSEINPTLGCTLQNAKTVSRDLLYGYKTVKLSAPVSLKKGETFTVQVTFTTDADKKVLIPCEGKTIRNPSEGEFSFNSKTGQSFVCVNSVWYDNTDWWGINYNNVPIKAMTKSLNSESGSKNGIYIAQAPDRTTYCVGESVDLTGLVVKQYTADGLGEEVSEYSVEPIALTQCGDVTVTVSATIDNKTYKATFTVRVLTAALTGIELENVPQQTGFLSDESVDLSMLNVRAYYSDNSSQLVSTYSKTVTRQAEGVYAVTIRYTENGISKSASFTVQCEEKVLSAVINGDDMLLTGKSADYTLALEKQGSPAYTVTWASSDPSVLPISQGGKVRALSDGTVRITATIVSTASQQTITVVKTVTVRHPKITSASIEGAKDLLAGDSLTLTAHYTAEISMPVQLSWSSSNTSVLSVSDKGVVSGKSDGSAVVTLTIEDNFGSTTTAKTMIRVYSGSVTSVKILASSKMKYEETQTAAANVSAIGNPKYTVTWSSSDSNIVSVDNNGNMTACKKGYATIKATVTDGSGNTVEDSIRVQVSYEWWQVLIRIFLFGFLWYGY